MAESSYIWLDIKFECWKHCNEIPFGWKGANVHKYLLQNASCTMYMRTNITHPMRSMTNVLLHTFEHIYMQCIRDIWK